MCLPLGFYKRFLIKLSVYVYSLALGLLICWMKFWGSVMTFEVIVSNECSIFLGPVQHSNKKFKCHPFSPQFFSFPSLNCKTHT